MSKEFDVFGEQSQGPIAMIQQVMAHMKADGSRLLGIAVFGMNDTTGDLHTFLGSKDWPHDLANWELMSAALVRTLVEARKLKEKHDAGSASRDPSEAH